MTHVIACTPQHALYFTHAAGAGLCAQLP